MEEEAKKEEEDEKWEREAREKRERDEERTRKNREKRNKKKGKKGGEKDKKTANGLPNGEGETEVKKKSGGLQVPRRGSQDEEQGSDFGVAEVVKETGITIHDDD